MEETEKDEDDKAHPKDSLGRFKRKSPLYNRSSGALGKSWKYRKRYAKVARVLSSSGATDAQLADFFAVNITTINTWKTRFPDFGQALIEGTKALTPFVERGLAQRAIGYTHDDEKLFYNSQTNEVIRAPIRTHYPPDVRAAERWLSVKGGKEWSAPQQIDHRVVVRSLTDADLAKAILDAQQLLALAPPEGGETP